MLICSHLCLQEVNAVLKWIFLANALKMINFAALKQIHFRYG
ncbi:MAG: hypothetical protein RL491_953 [Bacteroidota bacterium]|jgi:hypothetical protein